LKNNPAKFHPDIPDLNRRSLTLFQEGRLTTTTTAAAAAAKITEDK